MQMIVVGVDGSPPSLRALSFAADLAADCDDAELVVVFACFAYLAMPDGAAEAMFSEALDRGERSASDAAAQLLGARGLRWQFVTREGEPSQVLREVADEVHATVVVVGRRGWSTMLELVLGSVANRLVHRSRVPILVVPG
jgi:nucleotide-binding universal stress UspA family protein